MRRFGLIVLMLLAACEAPRDDHPLRQVGNWWQGDDDVPASVDPVVIACGKRSHPSIAQEIRRLEAELAAAENLIQRADREARLREARARMAKIKSSVKLKCPPDQPLC